MSSLSKLLIWGIIVDLEDKALACRIFQGRLIMLRHVSTDVVTQDQIVETYKIPDRCGNFHSHPSANPFLSGEVPTNIRVSFHRVVRLC